MRPLRSADTYRNLVVTAEWESLSAISNFHIEKKWKNGWRRGSEGNHLGMKSLTR